MATERGERSGGSTNARSSRRVARALLFGVLLACGCADDATVSDGGADVKATDVGADVQAADVGVDATTGAALADRAVATDVAQGADAATDVAPDASAMDAGSPDAGGLDAEARDVEGRDADAVVRDASGADVGSTDAGPGDAARPDAAASDAGEPDEDGYLPAAMPDSATRRCVSTTTNEVLACEPPPWRHYGQDGSYLIHVPSYTASADTVRDSVTGLEWQRTVAVRLVDYAGARDACDGLVLAGHDDWRLPGRLELVSLWDLGQGQPYVNVAAFGANVRSPFWSSSRAPGAGERWLVYFQETTGTLSTSEGFRGALGRCVRGGSRATAGRFTATATTVRDAFGGLEWSRDLSFANTWGGAIEACEALVLGSQSDWRLPNAKEMLSALADARANPAFDAAYFRWAPVTVWTSTPLQATSSVFGFQVDLASGISTGVPNRAATLPHACVRGG